MKEEIFKIAFLLTLGSFVMLSCGGKKATEDQVEETEVEGAYEEPADGDAGTDMEVDSSGETVQPHAHDSVLMEDEDEMKEEANVMYQCPMKCDGEKAQIAEAGKCPACGMEMERVEA